jgi:hypothetical protein
VNDGSDGRLVSAFSDAIALPNNIVSMQGFFRGRIHQSTMPTTMLAAIILLTSRIE